MTITSADAANNYTKSFGKVTFTEVGTYTYDVVETHHGETIDGIAYDESKQKTVTIIVKDKGDGTLIAEEGSNLVQTAEFENTYSGTVDVDLHATKLGNEKLGMLAAAF